LFVSGAKDLETLLENTLSGLGYEMVSLEQPRGGGLIRVLSIARVGSMWMTVLA